MFGRSRRASDGRPAQNVGGLERRTRRGRRRRRTRGGELVLGAGRGVGRFGPVGGVRAAAPERRPVPPAEPARGVRQLGRQPVAPGPGRAADQSHTRGTGQVALAAASSPRRFVPSVTHRARSSFAPHRRLRWFIPRMITTLSERRTYRRFVLPLGFSLSAVRSLFVFFSLFFFFHRRFIVLFYYRGVFVCFATRFFFCFLFCFRYLRAFFFLPIKRGPRYCNILFIICKKAARHTSSYCARIVIRTPKVVSTL